MRASSIGRLAVAAALCLAAPRAATADVPRPERYVAGKLPLEPTLVIERVAADGKATEVFRGGAPTAWRWYDAHTLVEQFDQDGKGDVTIAWITDGQPDPQHAIKLENTAWPPEAQAWSQYLAAHDGQLWLVREPGPVRKPARGKAAKATKPAKPVYQRVDVTPHVVQRDPPPGGVAARHEGRAWLDRLPSVTAPKAVAVTRTKIRIGRRSVGAVRCKPAKGAVMTFPSQATAPLLRLDIAAVRFVSPTLPLYVASGMTARPDGPAFDTAAFLGCTKEPLHTLAWGGQDVFLTIAGVPGGAGFSADDPRKMQLWVDGRAIAELAVLLGPVVSPAAAARAP